MRAQHMPTEAHRRILVVDDDHEVRRILTGALEKRGLIVHSAADGKEALELMAENAYGVVLLDLLMPEINGFDVLKWLQTTEMPSPPVVLVLTAAENDVLERLDPKRIHGLVRKPFDPDDLASLIVACSDIKGRGTFGTMAIATVLSGAQFLAWLNRFSG
jgi:CheY-like chemotaxis protein